MPNMCIAFFLCQCLSLGAVYVCMCVCVSVCVSVCVCEFRDLESGSSKTKLLGLERW